MVIIISSIFKIVNEGPDEVLVSYGKIFNFLGCCLITKVSDICVNNVN